MSKIGVMLIEQKRADHVEKMAEALFSLIINAACEQEPADRYDLVVDWKERTPVLNRMILDKTRDLFKTAGSDVEFASTVETNKLRVSLTPEASNEERQAIKLYWSRAPGKFVNKKTGKPVDVSISAGPQFTGTVREWYETLIGTIIDCRNQMVRQDGVTVKKLYVAPDVLTLLECSVLFRPNFDIESTPGNGDMVGTVARMFEVYKDPSCGTSIKLVGVKDGVRLVGEVEILDINII